MRSFFVEHAARAMSCLMLTFCAFAQADRGTITGTVIDSAAAVVPAAKVQIRNVDNGSIFETTTTATGDYTLTSLPAGRYEVSVEAAGFKKAIRPDVQVQKLLEGAGCREPSAGAYRTAVLHTRLCAGPSARIRGSHPFAGRPAHKGIGRL